MIDSAVLGRRLSPQQVAESHNVPIELCSIQPPLGSRFVRLRLLYLSLVLISFAIAAGMGSVSFAQGIGYSDPLDPYNSAHRAVGSSDDIYYVASQSEIVGFGNGAAITQTGTDNTTLVSQFGVLNSSKSFELGVGNSALLQQAGAFNFGSSIVLGIDNASAFSQIGFGNAGAQAVVGTGNNSYFSQVGNGNVAASANLFSRDSGVALVQIGSANSSSVALVGGNNTTLTSVVVGNGNAAPVLVYGGHNRQIFVIQNNPQPAQR